MIMGITWRGTAYHIAGRQDILRPSPLTEDAHQQVVPDGGHDFQVHAERSDRWMLGAVHD
jgi:hypothetical protein